MTKSKAERMNRLRDLIGSNATVGEDDQYVAVHFANGNTLFLNEYGWSIYHGDDLGSEAEMEFGHPGEIIFKRRIKE